MEEKIKKILQKDCGQVCPNGVEFSLQPSIPKIMDAIRTTIAACKPEKKLSTSEELEAIYSANDGNVSRGEIYEAEMKHIESYSQGISDFEENLKREFGT